MRKLLDYESITDDRQNLYTLRTAGGALIKHASAYDSVFSPEIAEFISKLRPKDNCHYSLCTALGAGEYWSSNINGDFFESSELINNHHTFLNGTPFMHHKNKDPNKGYGKILFSTYNPKMHRVELIVEYDAEKLPKNIVNKLENDELVNLSMGCRVAYDTCSICGNRAPTAKDYCDHVTKTGLNSVFPDGRKVFLYNPNPDFFDISIVVVPADKTACVLAKIFGAKKLAKQTADPMRGFRQLFSAPSAIRAEQENTKTASAGFVFDTIPSHDWESINNLAKLTKSADGLIAAIKHNNAYLKPNEAQAVLFAQNNMHKMAQSLLKHNAYFECDRILPMKINDAPAADIPESFSKSKILFKTGAAEPLISMPVSKLASIVDISPETLSEISRVSMLSALVGAAMSGEWLGLLPIISLGTGMAASSLISANNADAENSLRQRDWAKDLNIAPLIRAKQASKNLTLGEIYSISLNM